MVANPYQTPEGDLTVDDDGYGEIRFFSPGIRIGRLRYIAHASLMTLAFYVVIIPSVVLFQFGDVGMIVGGLLMGVGYIALMVVMVIFMIQRLHDLDKSGWLALLMLLPVLNLFVALYLLIWPGIQGVNNFGKRPPPNKTWHWIVGLTMPVLIILGIFAAIALPAYQDYAANSSISVDQ